MKVVVTFPNNYVEHLRKLKVIDSARERNKTDEEILRDFIERLLPALYGTQKKRPKWQTQSRPRRQKWFYRAVRRVAKHSDNPDKDILSCWLLDYKCKTLKSLKKKMYERYPFLKS